MTARIKKDDMVEVIAGDDKGTVAKVLSIDVENDRVVVEGVNRVFKHVRPSQQNPQGGRLEVERSIHISNVQPVNPKTNKGCRVSIKEEGGKKVRVAADGTKI